MKIAIDAMGGDNAPQAVIEGVQLVLPELPADAELLLFGDENVLGSDIADAHINDPRVKIVHTSQVIGCDEQPTLAIRKKRDSSMVRAVEAVANGEADCVLSAGSTGALLTGGTLIIKRLKGVKRPALATIMPRRRAACSYWTAGQTRTARANTSCSSRSWARLI